MRRHLLKLHSQKEIDELCEREGCHCGEHLWASALKHTLRVLLLIFAITALLNGACEWFGEEWIRALFAKVPQPVALPLCAVIGLLPGCSISVIFSELYVQGMLSVGCLMAGLLANGGVGVLVLFRLNRSKGENLTVLGILSALGTVGGFLANGIFG